MSHIALAVMLALQATGLWGQVSDNARTRIVAATTENNPASINRPVTLNMALPSKTGEEILNLSSAGVYAIDRTTSVPLYTHNAANKRSLASITKIMTILTVLSDHSVDEIVTIGELPSYEDGAVLLGLQPGQTFRLGDLVQAALIPSANDAADALAIYDSGSITKFCAQMNIKLSQWGIEGARFSTANGLTETDNYASSVALTRIAGLALANPIIRDTVAMQSGSISSTTGQSYTFTTTNKLLATGQFYGIKTGYTLQAGECFVGLAHVDGHEVIIVILGSTDRFGDTLKLTNWIGRNWQWL